jgi:hypothetical protein
MSAPAGSQIKIFDLNYAQSACPRRFFAQGQGRCFVGRHGSKLNRPCVPDDLIGKIDSLSNLFVVGIFERDVDFTVMFEHPETMRGRIEQTDKCGRKNVLARVLLQVVKPSQPINGSMH